MGAEVHIVDIPLGPDLDNLLLAKRRKSCRTRRSKPVCLDRVSGRPIAAVSYALCLAEIVDQLAERASRPLWFMPAAAGATGGGLAIGRRSSAGPVRCGSFRPFNGRGTFPTGHGRGRQTKPLNCSTCPPPSPPPTSTSRRITLARALWPPQPRRSRSHRDGRTHERHHCRSELTTGKAMAALIDNTRHGRLTSKGHRRLIHTGALRGVRVSR